MAMTGLVLDGFNAPGLSAEDVVARVAWLRDVVGPRLERFLGYYRNPMTELAGVLPCSSATSFAVRPFRQYQELGLPARITGFRRAADGTCVATGPMDHQRKEVVIENDIAWRVNTLVDFAAGRMPAVTSTARDAGLRRVLTGVINGLLSVGLLQELVLQGAVNGSAWVKVEPSWELLARLGNRLSGAPGPQSMAPDQMGEGGSDGGGAGAADAVEAGRWLRLAVVETSRLCPLPQGVVAVMRDGPDTPAPGKALRFHAALRSHARLEGGWLEQVRSWFVRPEAAPSAEEFSLDLFGPRWWQRYVKGVLTEEGANVLGVVPLVRYENAGDPAAGTGVGPAGSGVVDVGIGDVEPLIGLQDELNTRLSDWAFRVTMSSFRMYLGRGIEDFVKRPIGPGQMWATSNPEATIESFGGDAATPSEAAHIEEVREALDKISGVSPVAAGLIRGKLGNLTSAVALRLTLIALLARTERKRAALTRTMEAVVRMALAILDRAGVIATGEEDRGIDVNWPTALPESDMDRLNEAQVKLALGVPREVVLEELGYGEVAATDAATGRRGDAANT